jgi:hypothetical protein
MRIESALEEDQSEFFLVMTEHPLYFDEVPWIEQEAYLNLSHHPYSVHASPYQYAQETISLH